MTLICQYTNPDGRLRGVFNQWENKYINTTSRSDQQKIDYETQWYFSDEIDIHVYHMVKVTLWLYNEEWKQDTLKMFVQMDFLVSF